MTPKVYAVEISCTTYVQASSEEEARRITQSRITDIIDNDPYIIDVIGPTTKLPEWIGNSLPWTTYLYSGPEYTCQQIIDLQ